MLIVHEGKGDLEKSGGRTVCSILRLRMNDVSDGTALNEEGRAFHGACSSDRKRSVAECCPTGRRDDQSFRNGRPKMCRHVGSQLERLGKVHVDNDAQEHRDGT